MAIGDKKIVVMESDRAVPDGVATLDNTGILTEDQRPTAAQIGTYTKEESNQLLLKKVNLNFSSVNSTSNSEDYSTFCAKLDAVLNTLDNNIEIPLNVYPPQLYGCSSTQHGFLTKTNDLYASFVSINTYDVTLFGWRMIKNNGVWQPLEWLNPKMDTLKEYRTVERYMTKPVYIMGIDYSSALANTGSTQVSIPTLSYDNLRAIWVEASIYNGNTAEKQILPSVANGNVTANVSFHKHSDGTLLVRVNTYTDMTQWQCNRMVIKYTKVVD